LRKGPFLKLALRRTVRATLSPALNQGRYGFTEKKFNLFGPCVLLSGRDDPSAAHGLENLGEGRPIALRLTQIVGMLKIQGESAAARGSFTFSMTVTPRFIC
jgi:hypothetical protein